MPFSISKGGELTTTLPFVYEHDGGVVEERIQYSPSEVDREVRVETRTREDGTEETRTVPNQGDVPDGWSGRGEWFWEWIDRVTVGNLPFLDPQGRPMTATQIVNEYPEYRFLLREVENQIRQHHNPLSRGLMEMYRQRLLN